MTTSPEQLISIEAPRSRTPYVRQFYGPLEALGASIRDEGMRHPITLWKDGTLISGFRRHRACLLLGGRQIQAVFVDTVEDAAKALLRDNEDDHLALPQRWSEICALWALMRVLDEPAAARRGNQARRRGVELRRQTQAGKRKPGRGANHSQDYVLRVLAPSFGASESTAKRLWVVHALAHGLTEATDEKREQALQAMRNIDSGESSIWANYQRLIHDRDAAPAVVRPRPAEVVAPAAARLQRTAWDRSLPQMEGLVAGLVELGPPNADLTWEQVGPVHARLMSVRRDLEKIINKMRENNKP